MPSHWRGAMVFTTIWGGLMIGGKHTCYYQCRYESQFTHFMKVISRSVVTAGSLLAR